MKKITMARIWIIALIAVAFVSMCYAQQYVESNQVKSQVEDMQRRFSGQKPAPDAFFVEFRRLIFFAIINQQESDTLRGKDIEEESKNLRSKVFLKTVEGAGSDEFINLFIDWYGVDIKKEGASAFGRIIKVMGLSLLAIILIIILFTTVMRRTSFGIWMRSKIGGAAVGDIKTPKFKESLKRMLEAIRNFRKKDPLRE